MLFLGEIGLGAVRMVMLLNLPLCVYIYLYIYIYLLYKSKIFLLNDIYVKNYSCWKDIILIEAGLRGDKKLA